MYIRLPFGFMEMQSVVTKMYAVSKKIIVYDSKMFYISVYLFRHRKPY